MKHSFKKMFTGVVAAGSLLAPAAGFAQTPQIPQTCDDARGTNTILPKHIADDYRQQQHNQNITQEMRQKMADRLSLHYKTADACQNTSPQNPQLDLQGTPQPQYNFQNITWNGYQDIKNHYGTIPPHIYTQIETQLIASLGLEKHVALEAFKSINNQFDTIQKAFILKVLLQRHSHEIPPRYFNDPVGLKLVVEYLLMKYIRNFPDYRFWMK